MRKLTRHRTKFALFGLALTALLLLSALLLVLWPYNNLSIEPQYDVPIVSEQEYFGELPIVRVGEPFDVQYFLCNHGVSTTSKRWLDRYGSIPNFDVEEDDLEPVQSYQLPTVEFYNRDTDFCGEQETDVTLPDLAPAGSVYRYRVEVTSKPNVLSKEVDLLVTEPFVLMRG